MVPDPKKSEFFYFVMSLLSIRLQRGINRYNISFISQIIANNAFGASRPTLAALFTEIYEVSSPVILVLHANLNVTFFFNIDDILINYS